MAAPAGPRPAATLPRSQEPAAAVRRPHPERRADPAAAPGRRAAQPPLRLRPQVWNAARPERLRHLSWRSPSSADRSSLFSPIANRHMLRALAQAGGGAYEFFELTSKHTWAGKVRGHPVSPSSSALTQQHDPVYAPILRQVASQVKRMAAPGCSSVSVKWQQFNPRAPPPVQAPKQLQALFNDCHTLVYGFVPHCSQVRGLVRGCPPKKTHTHTSASIH